MAYLTYNKLSQPLFQKAFALNEINLSISSSVKVFLSYRRKDFGYIKPIIGLLNAQGVSIYIDYLDDSLPATPDHTTASTLRERLKKCKKFILLATPNSKDSVWMPWELGMGDGFIGHEHTLVLPLLTSENYWDEREYYKVYGYIKEGESTDKTRKDWAVFYPNGNALWLKDWLNK